MEVQRIVQLLKYTSLKKDKLVPNNTLFYYISNAKDISKIKSSSIEDFIVEYFDNPQCEFPLLPELPQLISQIDYNVYQFDLELNYLNLTAHPFLVTDTTVYAVKTISNFGRIRVNTILELFIYYAILRMKKINVTHIGVILPLQNSIERVDLSSWSNYNSFLLKVTEIASLKIKNDTGSHNLLDMFCIFDVLGTHVSKKTSLYETILTYHSQMGLKPLQVFLNGSLNTKNSLTSEDISNTKEYVVNNGIHLYVHAPYSINLCKLYPDHWIKKVLYDQLNTADKMNALGVVVHIGKQAKEPSYDTAYENMKQNIILTLEDYDGKCPLLLETSSGGSILDDPKQLMDFYLQLPEKIRTKIGICVDTCHVFAAGYDSLETLELYKKNKVPVNLIHYNDSKEEFGSKKDRHAMIGEGFIGLSSLYKVGMYAIKHSIDLVRE